MSKIREWLGLEYFVSPLDEFLKTFDKNHPKLSASQRAEIEKYQRIYRLRNKPLEEEKETNFWDKF